MKAIALLVLLACAATAHAKAPVALDQQHVLAERRELPPIDGQGAEPEPPVWPRSFEARYTLTLPYVTALQTGGLHMPVRVVYDAGSNEPPPSPAEQQRGTEATAAGGGNEGGGGAPGPRASKWRYRGERLRLELYRGTDITVTADGVVYSAYPRVNATACDQMAEPVGPTTAGATGANAAASLPSLAPFPVVSRPHWHYAGRALVPAYPASRAGGPSPPPAPLREAHIWQNTTRHAAGAKTSSYQVYVDAQTGLPLRFYMVGYNILASSHYDEYLLDFESFEARDFDDEEGGGDKKGGGGGGEDEDEDPFAIPAACPRRDGAREGVDEARNSRTLAGVAAAAAAAMPWSALRAAGGGGTGNAALASVAADAAGPQQQQQQSPSSSAAARRAEALAYIREWNARRDDELRLLAAAAEAASPVGNSNNAAAADASSSTSSPAPRLVRPLLRENHLLALSDDEYGAAMTAGAGGQAARRARAARAEAGGLDEDALARADSTALPPSLQKYMLGTLVPSYELEDEEGEEEQEAVSNPSARRFRLGRRSSSANKDKRRKRRPLPREVDWRGTAADPGAPTDQGTCGSCWAFAAAGAMSGAWAVATGQVRALSQQQMVDCGWRTGNNGCGGGWAERAIAYVADTEVSGGAIADEFYPYANANAWCGDREAWPLNAGRTPARGGAWAGGGGGGVEAAARAGGGANATAAAAEAAAGASPFDEPEPRPSSSGEEQGNTGGSSSSSGSKGDGDRDDPPPPTSSGPRGVARFRGVAAVRPHDDAALMDAVSRHGPVAVSIDASPLSFKFFGGGVYFSDECGWRPRDLDHAVLVVGYGTTAEGADYWLVRNSWSALWGDNGYIRVKRGFGVDCGITTAPFLAVVDEEAAGRVAGRAPLVEGWAAPRVAAAPAAAAAAGRSAGGGGV